VEADVRVYILKESDFEALRAALTIDPARVTSVRNLNEQQRQAHDEAHRFYNYQICNWIEAMKRDT